MRAGTPAVRDWLTSQDDVDWSASDTDLVLAAQVDPGQFVALYDRYYRSVYGYVRLRTKDRMICEDITSHVFLRALDRIGSVRPDGNVRGWLFTVARNAVHDMYRGAAGAGDTGLDLVADPASGPEDLALAGERVAELRGLVEGLRPDHQDLLALRYGAGMSFREIARITGKNPVAVRVSVHRILSELRGRCSHAE